MSNLSDLLPAGGGAKVITATADGNLTTGQAVALQSNGTVKAIGPQGSAAGSEVVFESADSSYQAIAFDSNANKIVIAYQDAGNSSYGTAIVGTVSGLSISFGTPVVFESANAYYISAAFDASVDVNKVVIAYADAGNSSYGTVVIGNVVGDSITFSSPAVYNSGTSTYNSVVYDSSQNNVVIAYRDESNSSYGTAIVGDVNSSGNSIAFGSEVVFESANTTHISATFDSHNNKVVIAYKDGPNSNYGTGIVGTVSGTSISFGTAAVFNPGNSFYISATFDSNVNRVVIAYTDGGGSARGTAVVGTVSGTDISFGAEVTFEASSQTEYQAATFDSVNNKVVIAYKDNTVDKGEVVVGTVNSNTNSISFDTAIVFDSDRPDWTAAVFDSNAKAVVIAYKDTGNSNYGTANVFKVVDDNSRDFVGITNQAINNSASGEVVVEGGVITNGSLLPQTFTPSVGSEAVFQSSATYYTASVYDPDSGKTIIAWQGTSNYGYAVVATPASDNSITYGTPVAFNSATTNYIDITYDTGQDKALITFTDASGSNKVRAVVGTVSGTSISFGSVLEVETNASDYPAVAYSPDSANSMVVYRDNGNSNYGTARVLTISGTSVSASSKVTFESANSTLIDIVYDTGSDKFVVSYSDGGNSNYGTSIVGSISGTTPSFGTATVYDSNTSYDINSAYDSANDKTVLFYKDNNVPTAIVGTVSGTSISFGTSVVVASQSNSDFYAMTFDSTANKIIVAYRDEDATPDDGVYFLGTVSGTSISFGSKQIFNDASTKSTSLSYNAGVDRTVIAYRDLGNSSYGTGIVLKITSANPNFTIGSTYYVQDDGTLSTTSSSVTAGKAIANTTLLLKG